MIQAAGGLKSGVPLQTRVGIATGLVVVGDLVGTGEAQERGIGGETPNLAAHLQAVAEPNTVAIAESTRKLLGNLFELEELGAKDLKGVAGPVRAWTALRASSVESRFEALSKAIAAGDVAIEGEGGIAAKRRFRSPSEMTPSSLRSASLSVARRPMRAWMVLRPSSRESRFEAMHASGLTELVGREEELEILLLRRWSKVKTGEGEVVLLSGEAGIGKSRLSSALPVPIPREPHTRLRSEPM